MYEAVCAVYVPRQGSEPGQVVDPVDGVANVDDFGKAFHLDHQSLRDSAEI